MDRNGTDEARAAAARLSERKNELMEYMSEGISMLLMENYIHYFYDDAEYIWQYLGKDSVIMIDDPDRVHEAMDFRNAETGRFCRPYGKGLRRIPRILKFI